MLLHNVAHNAAVMRFGMHLCTSLRQYKIMEFNIEFDLIRCRILLHRN